MVLLAAAHPARRLTPTEQTRRRPGTPPSRPPPRHPGPDFAHPAGRGAKPGSTHVRARDRGRVRAHVRCPREVSTASWLGARHQGRGIGTEMRAAVLRLAFDGLGAREARSGALGDNDSSFAVSRKLGYLPDGVERHTVRGRPVTNRRLRLPRDRWEAHRSLPVAVDGLPPCLPMFGAQVVGGDGGEDLRATTRA
ncbi:GNAT family N-acetyltransferase [Kitasatospora sp. NPDC051170]|uniref:GNAT family N-acetyltransferase n=1 Tax=Kitasatospora sp. NPDC051170 TaxID=3364056 RepID=UPI00379E1351